MASRPPSTRHLEAALPRIKGLAPAAGAGATIGIARGRVAERSKAPVLKTGNGQPFVGSNPTPSANRAGAQPSNAGLSRQTRKQSALANAIHAR